MTVINTNISALIANNAISQNDRAVSSSMEKLATGSRITSAKDDAAGVAMSSRIASQIGGLEMGVRNVNDAISLLNTADAATKEITNMLGRMRELAVQASSDTYTTTDREALDAEFGALLDEIDRTAATTKWNGASILEGAAGTQNPTAAAKSISIQSGAESSEYIGLTLNSWRTKVASDTEMSSASGADRDGVDPKVGEVYNFGSNGMLHNDAFELGGVTLIATYPPGGTAIIAANVKALMMRGANGQTPTNAGIPQATISGKFNGWEVGERTDFFSDQGWSLTNTGGPNATKVLGSFINYLDPPNAVAGYNQAVNTHFVNYTAGEDNVGAYGSGVLHWSDSYTRINITSASNASQAITELSAVLDGASAERAKYGAYLNRLQHAADNLSNISTNTSTSLSRITDTDYAEETTELARSQIITQASTAMLAQANQSKQSVLALLR